MRFGIIIGYGIGNGNGWLPGISRTDFLILLAQPSQWISILKTAVVVSCSAFFFCKREKAGEMSVRN